MVLLWVVEEEQVGAQMVSSLWIIGRFTWLVIRIVGSSAEEVIHIGELTIEAREEFIRSHLNEMPIGNVVVDFVEGDFILLLILHWECISLSKVSWVGHVYEEPLTCIGNFQGLSYGWVSNSE